MVSIDTALKGKFLQSLREREYSLAFILKYMRNFAILAEYADGRPVDKERLLGFRQFLLEKGYGASTINSALGTVNTLFEMLETSGDVTEKVKLRYERIQYQTFVSADKELTAEEYGRMVRLAEEKGDARLAMLLQTICALGIRVSELKAITVESVKAGKALIRNKRKERVILIPEKLARALLSYCAEKRIVSGMIFITRTGKALHRSNIWRMIKKIGTAAAVAAKKAFPIICAISLRGRITKSITIWEGLPPFSDTAAWTRREFTPPTAGSAKEEIWISLALCFPDCDRFRNLLHFRRSTYGHTIYFIVACKQNRTFFGDK